MKVAIVTAFPRNPSSPHGGVEAVSVTLAQALSEFEDLEIHAVTCDRQVSAPDTSPLGRVTVHRLPSPKGSELMTAVTSRRRLISDYIRGLDPDVVHAHDTYGLMVKGLNLPRVFTIHGFIYADTLVSGERLSRLRSKVWKWVETKGWVAQPHIISISPYVRERISGIVCGTIHDIENPISEQFFQIKRQEEPGRIFSSAVICPRKNTLALVDAFSLIIRAGHDAQLRLAGKIIDPEYGTAVKQKIISEKLGEKVFLLGQQDINQIKHELSRASLYALVSLEENAPLGIEEAMAAGVPVVASNRCGMPYMIRHNETGFLVDPCNSKAIADRCGQLLADRGLRSALGHTSRSTAENLYHPAKVALRTRAVYQEAISDFKSRRCRPA